MENTQPQEERKYKTPSYTRNAAKAYINRLKEKDIEAFNKRNAEYMQKSIAKIKEQGNFEEYKNNKREYMKLYRLKAKLKKQEQNPDI
jgi:hypothetical protein